ncbi:DrmB family protein [Actinomadura luteofluorescens]|uniref:DrmB family protein n=1 Tax=Actinomadura luteofluorescens TaxID=46163 RepID=UPI003D90954A
MTETAFFRRRVGSVRPSHLMFTAGVGALIDLPNFSVLVKGLDDWSHHGLPEALPIDEPRLLAAVQQSIGKGVQKLMPAPWMEGLDKDPTGPSSRIGVPVAPFPGWLRCTACNELGGLDSRVFGFENSNARKPHEARFYHDKCKKRKPLAVAARFVLSCTNGHLDDFPYAHFVHRGGPCPNASHPRLRMDDRGGNLGANVEIQCVNCPEHRNIRDAQGKRGEENLPRCRGRHPHLAVFDPQGCGEAPKLLIVGASNQWFAKSLAALAVPPSGASALDAKVELKWEAIKDLPETMYTYAREQVPAFRELDQWSDEEIAEAVARHRAKLEGAGGERATGHLDLRTAEWEVFSAEKLPDPNTDFTLRRGYPSVPDELGGIYADVVQAERLREVRALIGFTRLDAPDPEDPELVKLVRLSRSNPSWVPASEVRGEGIFLKVPEDLLQAWEERVEKSEALRLHQDAYARHRRNRYSDRIATMSDFDEMAHWPGARFIALHTLSHLLIRTIALECGYSSASLSERIYSGTDDDPHRSGILIYTAVPDAEGTLGGLVSLAEPEQLVRLTRRALADARHCSSDPLCAERLPHAPADFLHGAACHVCLFVSETTCERGNRFLDRRFVVPVAAADLALYPELP